MLTIRRLSQGAGYRYLMGSIAAGDGRPDHSSALTRYYAESGTPPGVFLGAGLSELDGGTGVEHGSEVSEEQLKNMLGRIVDPVSGEPVGQARRGAPASAAQRIEERVARLSADLDAPQRAEMVARITDEEHERTRRIGQPVAGFDLTFSPSKSVSVAWALADQGTKAVIYECHRRAIDYVLAYAERHVVHSRSGKDGVVQEELTGVIAASFTHWDSRAGDPQLHDHVVIWNRAKSLSDGQWRTLDSRGLFRHVVTLGVMHEGVLADMLTQALGVAWEATSTRGGMAKHEISAMPRELMAEFSKRKEMIETWRDGLVEQFEASYGRSPTQVELMHLNQQANLETRKAKEHHCLVELSEQWRGRAVPYLDADPVAFVMSLKDRNDLPLLRADDLGEEMLGEVAALATEKTAERHSTFSRANVLAEVHRQLHGVRFGSPDDRVAVAEHTTDLALKTTLQVTAPELHYTPSRFRRADGTSRMRPKDHHLYTTTALLDAEARLLGASHEHGAPAVTVATVAAVTDEPLPGKTYYLGDDQALAVEKIATSGRTLDVLVGPAGTGKTSTLAGLRAAWEAEHGAGSVIGLAPSAAAAEVLGSELGIETENTAKWLHEHRQVPTRRAERDELRGQHGDGPARRAAQLDEQVFHWSVHAGQLVIVDEASLAGTFALDELVMAAKDAGAKVLLVGDPYQLSSVDAGGMFRALVADRGDHVAELADVRRFVASWEKAASVALRIGDPRALDAYEAHGRITGGSREEMIDALYAAWKADVGAGKEALMVAGDSATVAELNTRARADRIAGGEVEEAGLVVAGGSAGVGDLVVTRKNNRLLATGKRWVKNGDRWVVIATNDDGSMAIKRAGGSGRCGGGRGGGEVVLPADYVAEHVELGYASTAHRAQGQSVNCAHVMVSPTTTREVLYVAATRGKESNRLYVDTCYDPDPATSHDGLTPSQNPRQVLVGCLANRGADLAASDAIRLQHDAAASIAVLQAEYQTLAAAAQESRWDELLACSGLDPKQQEAVRESPTCGSLFASLRDAEARSVAVGEVFPLLVGDQGLDEIPADELAGELRDRVRTWSASAGSRRREHRHFVVGLIPRARHVADPELARGLLEREQAMEARAHALVEQALASDARWLRRLGAPPADPARRAAWLYEVRVVAAYRDKWGGAPDRALGAEAELSSLEQLAQHRLAATAAHRALRIARTDPKTQRTKRAGRASASVTTEGHAVDNALVPVGLRSEGEGLER